MKRRGQGASPRNEAPQDGRTSFIDAVSAVSVKQYTTATPCSPCQHLCHWLVTWRRCHAYQHSYFTAGAPHQPYMACAGGRLVPTAVWDLVHEAAAVAMVQSGEV